MRKLSIAILLTAACLCADTLDNGTVTVTASRNVTQQPDQILLYITLVTAQDLGFDDVLAKLKGTGITAEHLQSVSPEYGSAIPGGFVGLTSSIWTFVLPAPFSKMKETLSTLAALQKSLGIQQGSNVLNFNVAGTSTSQSAQAAQQCPLTALVADARRQADIMASAAGLRAGAVVSVSDSPGAGLAAVIAVPTAAERVAIYDPLTTPYIPFGVIVGTTQTPCSLTVQFKLQP